MRAKVRSIDCFIGVRGEVGQIMSEDNAKGVKGEG